MKGKKAFSKKCEFNYKFQELRILNNFKRFLNLIEFTNYEESKNYKLFFDEEKALYSC